MNEKTAFHSLLETSCGYTGVNVKFPLHVEWWYLKVPVVTCYYLNQFKWTTSEERLIDLNPNICDKAKKKYNTFLVFHSGNIIMSGMCHETMKQDFYTFVTLLNTWKSIIEEKLQDSISSSVFNTTTHTLNANLRTVQHDNDIATLLPSTNKNTKQQPSSAFF